MGTSKPLWQQKTFWAAVVSVLSFAAAAVSPEYRGLLVSLGGVAAALGNVFARDGALKDATKQDAALAAQVEVVAQASDQPGISAEAALTRLKARIEEQAP